MQSRLTIDRGNTALKAAVWRSGSDDRPEELVSLPADASVADVADAIGTCGGYYAVAYSSVVKSRREADLAALSRMSERVIVVSSSVKLPFRNLYATPATLGADRIAALAGAVALGATETAGFVVADLGTAATYDYLCRDSEGLCYCGGNIAPGVPLRLHSLAEHTAALPEVSPELAPGGGIWGRSTADALLNGAVFGVLAELSFYRAASPDGTQTVLTGGGAEYLVRNNFIKFDHIYDPYLVMRGLNHIINEN